MSEMFNYENTPKTSIMNKLIGRVNLTPADAISEIVANSFDEKIDEKKMNVLLKIKPDEDFIQVKDNGRGMSKERLGNALIIGESSKQKTKKGIYGIGLKTSSAVLGKKLIIETKEKNIENILRISWDFEEFENKESWKVPAEILTIEESDYFNKRKEHGTVVRIQKLLSSAVHVSPIKDFISLAFRPHLIDGDEIGVNNTELLSPYKYKLISDTRKEIDEKIGNDQYIKGWLALQTKTAPKTSISDSGGYGFNIYRNKQLVSPFYKDMLTRKHMEYGKVIGEIEMNFIEVNYHKKGINKQKGWNKINEELRKIVKPFEKASKMTTTSQLKGMGGKIKSEDWEKINKEVLNADDAKSKKEEELILRAKKVYEILGYKTKEPKGKKRGGDIDEEDEKVDETSYDKVIELSGEGDIKILGEKIKYVFLPISDNIEVWHWHDSIYEKEENKLLILLNKNFVLLKKAIDNGKKLNNENYKSLCVIAFAEEIINYLTDKDINEIKARKKVYEWVNDNYDKIKVNISK